MAKVKFQSEEWNVGKTFLEMNTYKWADDAEK